MYSIVDLTPNDLTWQPHLYITAAHNRDNTWVKCTSQSTILGMVMKTAIKKFGNQLRKKHLKINVKKERFRVARKSMETRNPEVQVERLALKNCSKE